MKPEKILVLKDETLKVMLNSKVGTFHFTPPKVSENAQDNDSFNLYDVYCILFQMATGEHPPPHDSMDNPAEHLKLESLPPTFSNLLSKLLGKRSTAKDILEKDEFLTDVQPQSSEPSVSYPFKAGRIQKLITLVGTVFIIYQIGRFGRRVLAMSTHHRFPKKRVYVSQKGNYRKIFTTLFTCRFPI